MRNNKTPYSSALPTASFGATGQPLHSGRGSFMQEEIWRDVKDYESLYAVSSFGRMKSYDREVLQSYGVKVILKGKIFKQSKINGYRAAGLVKDGKRKTVRLHILIAQAFLPNPENKPQVNHKNGIKWDNRVENLEWATPSENGKHAYRSGLNHVSEYQKIKTSQCTRGSLQQSSVLKEADIPIIRKMKQSGMTNKKIAENFNVNRETIGYIIRGKTWKHVS